MERKLQRKEEEVEKTKGIEINEETIEEKRSLAYFHVQLVDFIQREREKKRM